MDTEEMYQRGVADAERGDLHPFYYQHYYPYRRGFDRTRRHLRGPRIVGFGPARWGRLALVSAFLIVVGAGAFVAWRSRSQPTTAARGTVVIASTARTLPATVARTPLFPTITPSPAVLTLHSGGAALVANTGRQPLRGRSEPHLKAPIRVAFKEGERVRILEGPVQADGYIWWRIEGQNGVGWSAERSKEGAVWLQPAK